MKTIKCPITGSKENEILFEIKKFPIFVGVSKLNKNYKFNKMRFIINKEYGTVQINPKVSPERLYFAPHGSGKIGNVWKNHHKIYFETVQKYFKGNILEIGGGDQSIVKKIKSFNGINKVYVCGKNISLKKQSTKVFIFDEFFSSLIKKHIKPRSVNLICHSHTFEHIYDINKFLRLVNHLLTDEGMHIFSIPNMRPMIENNQGNAMNFEHPFYYDEKLVETILKYNGFRVLKKKFYLKNHSIIYETKKNKNIIRFDYENFNENKILFLNLYNSWLKDVKKISSVCQKNEKVYLFGAHIFSQILIFNGLNENKVEYILDNDPDKIGNYLYGTNLLVKSPSILKNIKNAKVVLRVGGYKTEIESQIKKINKSVIFI